MLDFIYPSYFLIALFIGLLYTYLTAPYPTIIYKYPTPLNAGKITYVDDAGVCYKYKAEIVTCPNDRSKVKSLPT
jgi:hypothetical protein